MEKRTLKELTNEDLIKKRDLLKGVFIGFGIVFILAISIILYLFSRRSADFPFAVMIPIFVLPITFLPILINLSAVNKEIKLRNL